MHERVERYEAGLAVGFSADGGELVVFEDARVEPGRLLPVAKLSSEQRVVLALARVERAEGWPEREVYPGGFIDRARAVREIREGSELGELLVDTEVRVASWVVGQLELERSDG